MEDLSIYGSEEFRLNLCQSVQSIAGNAKQVMVYGYTHCKYDLVRDVIARFGADYGIEKQYTHQIGQMYSELKRRTLEGRDIEEINILKSGALVRYADRIICKTAVTILILENWKRSKEGLEIIPTIVCVDTEDNAYPLNIEAVADRTHLNGRLMTHSELRRIYKLSQFHQNGGHKDLAAVARKTMVYVKVKKNGSLEPIQPFWKDPHWSELWKITRNSEKDCDNDDKIPWKDEVKRIMESYKAAH